MATNPLALAEANFRLLLATGKPIAFEDARRGVELPEGFDPRTFGAIVVRMARDGEIAEVGYRRGTSSRCNQAMKRLWVLADPSTGKPVEVARG